MAESRVEKFREYRKSIISDGENINKTPIETSLAANSTESKVQPTEQELYSLKKIEFKKRGAIISFLTILFAFVLTFLILGIILFK